MKNIVIGMATALVLATTGLAQAEEAKAPTSKAECIGLLKQVGDRIKKEKPKEKTLMALHPKGKAMYTYCDAEDFGGALKMIQQITKILNESK